jgi:hypothetical protein
MKAANTMAMPEPMELALVPTSECASVPWYLSANLQDFMDQGLHALAIEAKTPAA